MGTLKYAAFPKELLEKYGVLQQRVTVHQELPMHHSEEAAFMQQSSLCHQVREQAGRPKREGTLGPCSWSKNLGRRRPQTWCKALARQEETSHVCARESKDDEQTKLPGARCV